MSVEGRGKVGEDTQERKISGEDLETLREGCEGRKCYGEGVKRVKEIRKGYRALSRRMGRKQVVEK